MPRVSEAYLEERREEMLQAARACFARKGFAETTMREIATEAGVSYGVVYHYFASKEEIVTAAWERGLAERAVRFEKAERPDAAADVLAEYVRLTLERWSDPAKMPQMKERIQMLAGSAVNETLREVVEAGLVSLLDRLAGIVQRGQRRGEVTPELDPKTAACAMFALTEGLVVLKALDIEIDVGRYTEVALALLDGRFLVGSGSGRHGT